MTVGSVVAAGSAGCKKCPYPRCTFAFDPERCTNKDADGERCNQLFHHICQTELEMEVWRKSTQNVDELIAAGTGNPFESATTKICYHCHENIIIPAAAAAAAAAAPAPAAQPTAIDLLDSDDDVATAPVNTITANAHPNPSPLTANTTASLRTSTTPATLNLHQATSRKPKNNTTRELYTFTNLEGGKTRSECNCCGEVRTVATVNISQLSTHIMEKCTGATVAQKEKVRKTTQRGKKIKMVTTLTSLTPGGTVGTETLQQVRDYAMAARSSSSSTSASQPPPRKKVKKTVPTHQSKMTVMTAEEMAKVFEPYVIAKVAENNPLSDLLKPYFKAALISSHPGIGVLLPDTVATIYKDFIVDNAKKIRNELIENIIRRPGDINLGSDGVTINSKSKQVYTVSKGEFSVFYCFTDLGSLKHNTNAEIEDLVKVSTALSSC
jgi:hypothetical protein